MPDDREFWDEMAKEFRQAHEDRRRTEHEFERLALDPCCDIPEVGDTVIVAAGMLGLGFAWVRSEAVVEEVGQSSYKVRFHDKRDMAGNERVLWVHPALITDVISHARAGD